MDSFGRMILLDQLGRDIDNIGMFSSGDIYELYGKDYGKGRFYRIIGHIDDYSNE